MSLKLTPDINLFTTSTNRRLKVVAGGSRAAGPTASGLSNCELAVNFPCTSGDWINTGQRGCRIV